MNTIHLTHIDHQKITALLKERRLTRAWSKTDAFLEAELSRAQIVAPKEIPADVVTMNSHVRFVDTATGEYLTYWLVFPEHADASEGKISILSPVGSALIGYRVGDTFAVETGPRTRTLRVEEVTHQPEAHSDHV